MQVYHSHSKWPSMVRWLWSR
ncbi:MAG: hypothetical protein ACKVHP_11160, partial [Verrucomicrobiales bacterium]